MAVQVRDPSGRHDHEVDVISGRQHASEIPGQPPAWPSPGPLILAAPSVIAGTGLTEGLPGCRRDPAGSMPGRPAGSGTPGWNVGAGSFVLGGRREDGQWHMTG